MARSSGGHRPDLDPVSEMLTDLRSSNHLRIKVFENWAPIVGEPIASVPLVDGGGLRAMIGDLVVSSIYAKDAGPSRLAPVVVVLDFEPTL